MKNILIIFLIFSCTVSLFAQEDRFSDINQIRGKEIYVTDNSPLSVAFSIINGKVKPINKIKNLNISLAGKVFSVENGVYTFKDIDYVILKGKEETILLKVEEAPLYLSSFVSKTYWQEKYDLYKDDYIYLNFKKFNQPHSEDATIEYDDLSRIEWRNLELTDSCVFYWMCEFNGVKPLENFKISSSYFEEIKDLFFVKKNDIQPYVEKYKMRLAKDKREKEISDSIANSKVRLAISLIDFIDDDDIAINVHKGDTIAVFSYNPSENKYVARFHYSNLLFKFEDIEFLDTKRTTTDAMFSWDRKIIKTSADADFLKMKGEDGKEQRFVVAAAYDDIKTTIYINKLKSAINKEAAYRKRNQIFITGIGYVFDSGRFGMRFDVHNCFSKTIKYVEFTMVNYNAVGDVQRDDLGRSSRTVRGIGPIEPEEGGRYSWADIFWDDRDVIDKTNLTKVKFIFVDGTTKVFSGYANIKKHMTSDAWD